MTDLQALTADQLRALFARTPDAVTRRAIQRRLQQLDDLPEPPAVTTPPPRPQMQSTEYRARLLALRPPTTRSWWSLEQITDALDRTAAELHERSKEGK